MYETSDFFYSVITFSYIKCFVHSYTVDVVFTLSYKAFIEAMQAKHLHWSLKMAAILQRNAFSYVVNFTSNFSEVVSDVPTVIKNNGAIINLKFWFCNLSGTEAIPAVNTTTMRWEESSVGNWKCKTVCLVTFSLQQQSWHIWKKTSSLWH